MDLIEKIWHEHRPFVLFVLGAAFLLLWGQSSIAGQFQAAAEKSRANDQVAASNELRRLAAEERSRYLEDAWQQLGDGNPLVSQIQGLLFTRRPEYFPSTENPTIAYGRLRSKIEESAIAEAKAQAADLPLPVGLGLPEIFPLQEADEAFARLDLTERVVLEALRSRIKQIVEVRQLPREKPKKTKGPSKKLSEISAEVTVLGELPAIQAWLAAVCREKAFLEISQARIEYDSSIDMLRARVTFSALEPVPAAKEEDAPAAAGPSDLPELPILPFSPGKP